MIAAGGDDPKAAMERIGRAQLDAARERIRGLEAELATERRWAAKLACFLEEPEAAAAGEHRAAETAGRLPRGSGGLARRMAAAAVVVLREAGRPMPLAEVMAALRARGVRMGGVPDRDARALTQALSHSPDVVFTVGAGWGLPEWDGGTGGETGR